MERDEVDDTGFANVSGSDNQALNPTILEYYKKFGRKRDLEQYFSLSTAQGEVKDPTSLFWRRMKSQTDSSDSGEKSRESSLEVCRISIRCSAPDTDAPSSQDENPKTKSDTESPPIIIEEVPPDTTRHTDDEYAKSDDNNSQKSLDAVLDTSMIKALSPSSSITSQRKLEWDSLADVGYANESDKKTSASSLSTLERLALKQQYSNNDSKEENLMGNPTAHSTPVDDNDKPKGKRGSKTTKIYRRDVEFVEFNMPHSSNANLSQSINVNLTKHISFNVEKDGGVSVENVKKDVSVSPEKASTESKVTDVKMDKQIQTSLIKTKDESIEAPKSFQLYGQAVPVLINLNTLKKRIRKKKVRTVKKKVRTKKKYNLDKENLPVHEKSGEQVSEAESFEYMPGHIYNQNQLNQQPAQTSQAAGNKSSLESSGAVTTDSSKGSKLSFTRDLEKSIKLLKTALHKRYNDSELKDKLIKEVVERLLKSSYRDDETTTDFLSGLSYSSKKLGLGESHTTTSTSDANNTAEKNKRPKKSILRVDKFNPNAIASTSQSAPNIPSVSNSEKLVASRLAKALTSSNTESDVSSKDKSSPDTAFAKTSSEELYQKYLDALRRENAYKKHLRDKELFLKQKLVSSDTAFNIPVCLDPKSQSRIKELMNDLTRNNYDDGSGDASKLEGGLGSNLDLRYGVPRNQRSHSVFTLSSSGNSDPNRKSNLKKSEMKDSPKAGHSREVKEEKHYCCCPHHNKMGVTDSSVQVNIKCGSEKTSPRQEIEPKPCRCGQTCCQSSPRPITRIVSDNSTGDIKYVCLCNNNVAEKDSSENVMIYKCSRLTNKGIQSQCAPALQPDKCPARSRNKCDHTNFAKFSKCSQTNLKVCTAPIDEDKETVCIHEAVRIIQTDISIDPKISDPILSDIKIVKPCDCVKLVRERYRQVSKSSIASDANVQPDYNALTSCPCSEASVATPSTSSSCSKTKGERLRDNRAGPIIKETVDAEIQSTVDIPTADAQTVEDNYTIPIQGTNIVLKVSVGPNAVRVLETLENVDSGANMNPVEHNIVSVLKRNNNAVATDAINTAENATCLTEECSKGVQSQNDDIFSQFDTKQSLLRALFTSDEYPNLQSTSAVNSRRPLLRAKTSTCIVTTAQKDFSTVPSQQQKSMETMTERSNTYPKSQQHVQFDRQELAPGMIQQIPMGVFRFQGPEGVTYDKLYMKDRDSEPKRNRNTENQTQSISCNVGTSQSDIDEITEPVKRKPVDDNEKDQCGISRGVSCGESSYDFYLNLAAQDSKISKCCCPQDSLCQCERGDVSVCRNQKSVCTGPETPLQTIEERYYSEDASEPHASKASLNPYEDSNKKTVLCGPDSSPSTSAFVEAYSLNKGKEIRDQGCGCDISGPCKGECGEDAVCRQRDLDVYKGDASGNQRAGVEIYFANEYPDRAAPKDLYYLKDSARKQTSCGCSTSGPCKGECGEDAACRKRKVESSHDSLDRPINYRDSELAALKDGYYSKESARKQTSCGCSTSGPCKGECGEDAACRKRKVEGCHDSLNHPNYRDSEFAALRDAYHSKESARKQTSCGCSTSGPCKGECGEDAACRKRKIEGSHVSLDRPIDYRDSAERVYHTNEGADTGSDSLHRQPVNEGNRYANTYPYSTKTGHFPDDDKETKQEDSHNPSHLPFVYCDSDKAKDHAIKSSRSQNLQQNIIGDHKSKYTVTEKKESAYIETQVKGKGDEKKPKPTKEKSENSKDLIMNVIQDITNRYSKKYTEKTQRKKCFKEIISLLSYLLDTEDSTDTETIREIKNMITASSSSELDFACHLKKDKTETEDTVSEYENKRRPKSPTHRSKSPKSRPTSPTRSKPSKSRPTSPTSECAKPPKSRGSSPSCAKPPKSRSTSPKSRPKSPTTKEMKSVGTSNDAEDVFMTSSNSYYHETKRLVHKGIQISTKKSKSSKFYTESSDVPKSTDITYTSSDSATCKVLNKIRKECEKYHQKRCKAHNNATKKCECTSTTSLSCDQCKRVHHCICRTHKCKGHRPKSVSEKPKKKCVAYNLIIQTSESMISEETKLDKNLRPLKNIIVKVPPKRRPLDDVPHKLLSSPRASVKGQRSRSLPNENYVSSTDDGTKTQVFTVRDYLEKNRPDFVDQTMQRQNCLKILSEARANERAIQRELLSMQVQMDGEPSMKSLSESDLRKLARKLGLELRHRQVPPKFISEHDMKKHSEKIYKKLPEVLKKKEDLKKENIKKTNLLMASIFKKNLQKKVLHGSVNLSNYSTVIKI
ncbi:uncharacterized protein LOC126376185 isoform X3 [Pectinophora gossypiella]|uniref:uncharacterized protein LOC126376185 isoform X3 n=1 Tax=Pectinophora gossypiella TaxID=13191 RepID=UPI00214E2A61|nr:uncharacterized protein LOC126376185 isoform X3 [Pectinophora gossypiella]